MSEPPDLKNSTVQSVQAAAEQLAEATTNWLASLPPGVQPVVLARDFPRIANKLCELWKRPAQFEPYLAELIFDHRGGRQGFPLAVASELADLKAHHATIYPRNRSVWDTQFRT
jgi:hypothetical protein